MAGGRAGKPNRFADGGETAVTEVSELRAGLKELIVSSLKLEGIRPESIHDDEPLFGEGLGLDSVDGLELVVAVEKHYGIRIEDEEEIKEVFGSVSRLAAHIDKELAGRSLSNA